MGLEYLLRLFQWFLKGARGHGGVDRAVTVFSINYSPVKLLLKIKYLEGFKFLFKKIK